MSTATDEHVVYRSHTLRARPPWDGIPIASAARQFGMSEEKIWSLIDRGVFKAGVGMHPTDTKKCALVSRRNVERHVATKNSIGRKNRGEDPPQDGAPANELARLFGVRWHTVRKWCGWPTHPALGRRLRNTIGPYSITRSNGQAARLRGLIVSRSDLHACVEILRMPLNRPIMGNPGLWIADGIFRHHDGRVFFSRPYVRDNKARFGLPANTLNILRVRKKLDFLKVIWPAGGENDRWTRLVYSEASLDKLVERRDGKADGGRWLVDEQIWRDAEGFWFSSSKIAHETGRTNEQVHRYLRSSGMTDRFKRVPRSKKGGGTPPVVYHEDDVRQLLGAGNGKPSIADGGWSRRAAGRKKSDATIEVERFCHEQKVAGKKLAQIRIAAEREFGTARAPKSEAAVSVYATRYAEYLRKTRG